MQVPCIRPVRPSFTEPPRSRRGISPADASRSALRTTIMPSDTYPLFVTSARNLLRERIPLAAPHQMGKILRLTSQPPIDYSSESEEVRRKRDKKYIRRAVALLEPHVAKEVDFAVMTS